MSAPTTNATDAVLSAIDRVADKWAAERDERLQRQHLDPADFAALRDTGYLRLIVPTDQGGLWESLAHTGPILVEVLRRLAHADQSVALVASMHPSVLIFWTTAPVAPDPFTKPWAAQRAEVFQSAVDGHFWGTITSEPGSGGDILKTKATATPVDGSNTRFSLHGAKHFGSGSEVVSYMITTAKPDGLDEPLGFFMDLRDQPWDGTDGLTITRPWDGMGMKATQSHAVMLEGVHGVPLAWPEAILHGIPAAGTLGLAMYSAIIVSVVDAAMAEAAARLGGRPLRPYEDVEWTQAQVEHWMLTQADEGLVRTIATVDLNSAVVAAVKAKIGMSTLAETILSRVCRAVGGGAFSSSSPFASWYEDVRALGYLRPPWALAFDQLIAARQDGQ